MIRRITKHGETVLKGKSEPVDLAARREELPDLLKDMWETMYAAKGVGLAGPQIDVPLRIAIIDTRPEGKPDRLVLINPVILEREGAAAEEEGCLSVPGLYAKVKRHARVRVRALDENGRAWERVGTGLLARAFEHEVDHLEGKLFLDHLDFIARLRVASALKELKKSWT